jgi:hypothetical protein
MDSEAPEPIAAVSTGVQAAVGGTSNIGPDSIPTASFENLILKDPPASNTSDSNPPLASPAMSVSGTLEDAIANGKDRRGLFGGLQMLDDDTDATAEPTTAAVEPVALEARNSAAAPAAPPQPGEASAAEEASSPTPDPASTPLPVSNDSTKDAASGPVAPKGAQQTAATNGAASASADTLPVSVPVRSPQRLHLCTA